MKGMIFIGLSNAEKYIHIDKDELYDIFIVKNKTRKECAEYFKCSEATIKKKCRMYKISKKPDKYILNNKKTLKETFGTDELWNISNEKRKATNIKKFGVEKPFQSLEIQDTIANKRKNKYSNEEKIVKEILDKYKIKYEKEYPVFINNKNNYFDFKLTINNKEIFIEVDGIFHIKNIHGNDRLQRSIKEEQLKNEYCFNNNIELIRIPYFIKKENKEKIILDIISPD